MGCGYGYRKSKTQEFMKSEHIPWKEKDVEIMILIALVGGIVLAYL